MPPQGVVLATEADYKQLTLDAVVARCRVRKQLYARMTPALWQSKGQEAVNASLAILIQTLDKWAKDPVEFIRDIGWSPDPKGIFGGRKIPEGLAPPRMVPILLYPKQEEFIRNLHLLVQSDEQKDLNLIKSRQLAATTLALLFLLWAWLFFPGFSGLLGSYDKDAIDPGGKGHRQGDSLFSRFRMLLDGFGWSLPHCAFNAGRAPRGGWGHENRMHMGESEDARGKLTRPYWEIYKRVMYPEARGNFIKGVIPGDKFGKGDIFTLVLMDEFGDYDAIGPGADKDAWSSVRPCCLHIVTQGTIPKGGGLGSEFKSLCDAGNSSETLINMSMDWSDVGNYMLGAEFKCPLCQKMQPYGRPSPGPGEHGIKKPCETCKQDVWVKRATDIHVKSGEVTSPWWERTKESYRYDRTQLARYFLRDWLSSSGDRAFYTFDPAKAVAPRPETPGQGWHSIDGFDPGWSEDNPAAWVLLRFSHQLQMPRIVAWHMAAQKRIDWWVPFFRRWSPERLPRMRVLAGADAGKVWTEVHYYSPAELEILQRISRIPRGEVEGDKYGSHKTATGDDEYTILSKFGIDVQWEYTTSRELLISRARDLWMPRLEIDPSCADHRPLSPRNQRYPSMVDCLATARMRTTKSGQGEPKKDIDKNNPKHVSHPIDAVLYAFRRLPDEVRAVADIGGDFNILPEREVECVTFGETWPGQFD